KTHTIYKAGNNSGCRTCKGNGYKGRRAISEALYFSREIRHMIVEADTKIDEDGLRELARSQGMLTLQDSAREVVKMGESFVEAMMRVTMSEGYAIRQTMLALFSGMIAALFSLNQQRGIMQTRLQMMRNEVATSGTGVAVDRLDEIRLMA